MTIAAMHRVSKWYGQVLGLSDVSVEVPPGVVGLLGPNGAGKSTLLKLLTGQLKPSQGTVTAFEQPVWGNPEVFAKIGYCPEHDGFYERMSGLDWVAGLASLTMADANRARAAAQHALERLGLSGAASEPIGRYSKGMRQRLKLAQAIAHEPELLVLDEPLSGMDPLARQQATELLREWAHAGRSVILSSHILHEVEALTTTIVLIHQGRVVADGDIHRIRDLLDEHPHTVCIRAEYPRALARDLLGSTDVQGLRLGPDEVVVQTTDPDAFFTRLTALAASGGCGAVTEVTSPDDTLESVFKYLVS